MTWFKKRSKTEQPNAAETPTVPKVPLKEKIATLLNNIRSEYRIICEKAKNLRETNLNLGQQHLDNQRYGDAVLRFKLILWRLPQEVDAWVGLAKAYQGKEEMPKALSALDKALILSNGRQDIQALRAEMANPRVSADDTNTPQA